MTHELKILPEWYDSLASGMKSFEVRKDDRNPRFEPNDELFLREFDGTKYTGRTIRADVKFVLRGKYCKDGYCIMSVAVKSKYPDTPMTNYERIKNMSVEEIADILVVELKGLTHCIMWHSLPTETTYISKFEAMKDSIKWLESEVDGE